MISSTSPGRRRPGRPASGSGRTAPASPCSPARRWSGPTGSWPPAARRGCGGRARTAPGRARVLARPAAAIVSRARPFGVRGRAIGGAGYGVAAAAGAYPSPPCASARGQAPRWRRTTSPSSTELLDAAARADGHQALADHQWLDLVHGGRAGLRRPRRLGAGPRRIRSPTPRSSRGNDSWGLELVVAPAPPRRHWPASAPSCSAPPSTSSPPRAAATCTGGCSSHDRARTRARRRRRARAGPRCCTRCAGRCPTGIPYDARRPGRSWSARTRRRGSRSTTAPSPWHPEQGGLDARHPPAARGGAVVRPGRLPAPRARRPAGRVLLDEGPRRPRPAARRDLRDRRRPRLPRPRARPGAHPRRARPPRRARASRSGCSTSTATTRPRVAHVPSARVHHRTTPTGPSSATSPARARGSARLSRRRSDAQRSPSRPHDGDGHGRRPPTDQDPQAPPAPAGVPPRRAPSGTEHARPTSVTHARTTGDAQRRGRPARRTAAARGAPTEKLIADVTAACTGRARSSGSRPSSSRACEAERVVGRQLARPPARARSRRQPAAHVDALQLGQLGRGAGRQLLPLACDRSASSASRCELTELYSPTAIDAGAGHQGGDARS